ncbi:longitudinals lacking protein, isoforms A/B/D/L-like isoform X18 [Ceratina calcarata]|uniref:Longitudinals lacking protein, isoforms A/B/D/L-like isoform X18 n=1 Tax=Ceratina calcarata TaxID=156304 RepID=A0AAJ7J968_9HYME|nr:longitudinals lacking protein, isoforms A/B/D/L-like isoform X18 [Ceratina calcarata]
MEDDQQFCLRWNNHQTTLIQNFDTLLESGTLVDCTLAAEGKYLKAHKVVLSACSPYFEGLLSEHYDKHPVFILKDVKFKELKAMMDYMYRGEVNISQDQLAALLKAAESLQIKGLSESRTGSNTKTDSRQQKVVPQTTTPTVDIPLSSSGLTIEKNKVPRLSLTQASVVDLPEESASPQITKGLSSREGSQSPTARKRKRMKRRSISEDNSTENHEASNSSDMPQQQQLVGGGPALGIAPVADEKSHADPTDSIGRSALMTQLTKPADEMLQLALEKPEPNDSLIEPKSEYLEDAEEGVEDLTLDDDMNDLTEMEQDNNRAGPSHDPSQHPAGIGSWHVTGDRSNAGGVVGSVGALGTTDEVLLAAQEAVPAHRDSQENGRGVTQVERFYGRSGKEYMIVRRNGMYECPSCLNLYKWRKSMLTHLRTRCKQLPRFECPHCTMKNYRKSHMIRHLYTRHPQLEQTFWDRTLNSYFTVSSTIQTNSS